MNDEILVSISMLSFNHEKYIREAIEGVLMQETDFRYHLYIHDDASTDRSADIIREYAEKYPDRITAICQSENQFSKGVRIYLKFIYPLINSKYIAFCEGDDYWTDCHKLQKQIDFLESHPDYVAIGNSSVIVDENSKPYPENSPLIQSLRYTCENDHDFSLEEVEAGRMFGQTASRVIVDYRRRLTEEQISFIDNGCPHCYGDEKLSLTMFCLGKVRCMSDKMSAYRRTYTGFSNAALKKGKNTAEKKMLEHVELANLAARFGKTVDYSTLKQKQYMFAISFFIRHPNRENLRIMKVCRKNCEKKGKVFGMFVKNIFDGTAYHISMFFKEHKK